MPLDSKKLSDLVESDIQDLITNGVEERRELDYKQRLKTSSDGDKKEFLADVSSFANASGGDLIFGVAEAEGRPTEITPMTVENWDKERLQLESTIRDGISPRIAVEFAAISVATGGYVVILRIPRSWTGPHMVTFQHTGKFFSRHSAGKYPLDVGQLRNAFTSGAQVADSIRAFRQNRLAAIVSGETPLPMPDTAKLVIHCCPYAATSIGSAVDIHRASEQRGLMRPISRVQWTRYNLDGLVAFALDYGDETVADSYCQLFRDGNIECVDTYTLSSGFGDRDKSLWSLSVEAACINGVKRCLELLRVLEVQPPIAVSVSLLGVRSFEFIVGGGRTFSGRRPKIDRDALIFSTEIAKSYHEDALTVLEPTMHTLWNTAGLKRCPHFDEDGKPTKALADALAESS